MYKAHNKLIPVDPGILKYVLKVKGREVPNCELLSVAHSFETEMLAWIDRKEKRRLEA